ncbi:hypothetical protein [Comamonas aquatica]|uniref:hypothetical protein n=1 Tax=Comamonas aquatica TaxID=225991 RepID=UPI00244B6B95|nr:hypothetical protein [Comamonas aquatica]MDH0200095.1 hypothetical protein [Comamonas aquatica]MDH1446153.1 hypothetical protein [Comamonas aquatica]
MTTLTQPNTAREATQTVQTTAAPQAAPARAARQARQPIKGLSTGTLVFLILLTAIYLTFELAFNARLLDVVGGGASADDVHNIEISGRLLSGIAVALVVLQLLLTLRARRVRLGKPAAPGIFGILLLCSLTVGGVYLGLQKMVDRIVESRSTEFRRQALNITLIQKAIVDGRVQLAGMDADKGLYARPEGKAFLALFPAMAASVHELDRKIEHAKLTLIADHVGNQAGGIQGYYKSYQQAMDGVAKQWRDYNKLGSANIDVEAEVAKQHRKAWNDYLSDLGKRGWTPSTVPVAYEGRVRQNVRRRVPVSSSWDLRDEASFRDAIDRKVRSRFNGKVPEVKVRGQRIPPGLSQAAFTAHPAVQAELRDKLKLPSGVSVPMSTDADGFRRNLYDPMRMSKARTEAAKYTAPLQTFADGGSNAAQGLDATRAALVPPIALLCSLLGAIGHLGKLLYLLSKLVLRGAQSVVRAPWLDHVGWLLVLIPFALAIGIWTTLSHMDNSVTTSELYQTLTTQTLQRTQADDAQEQRSLPLASAIVNALHVVAVGQGYAYPYNEHLRVHYLQGITFGYHPKD